MNIVFQYLSREELKRIAKIDIRYQQKVTNYLLKNIDIFDLLSNLRCGCAEELFHSDKKGWQSEYEKIKKCIECERFICKKCENNALQCVICKGRHCNYHSQSDDVSDESESIDALPGCMDCKKYICSNCISKFNSDQICSHGRKSKYQHEDTYHFSTLYDCNKCEEKYDYTCDKCKSKNLEK